MTAPVTIDALGRDDLVALVRMAIARGALRGDDTDLATARVLCLEARAAELRAAWQAADMRYREVMAAAEAVEDDMYRRQDYVFAANECRAAGDVLRTAHRIWRRADDRAQQARQNLGHELRTRFQSIIADQQKGCSA